MTIGEYYRDGYAARASSLAAIRKDILTNVSKKNQAKLNSQKLKELKDFYKSIFYPSTTDIEGQKKAQVLKQLIEQIYLNVFGQKISDFTMGTSAVVKKNINSLSEVSEQIKIIQKEFNQTQRIAKTTVEATRKKVENRINDIVKNLGFDTVEKGKSQVLDVLIDYEKALQNFIKLYSNNKVNLTDAGYMRISKKNTKPYEAFKQLQSFEETILSFGSLFSSNDFGQVLEIALQAFSSDKEKELEDFKNSIAQGIVNKTLLEKFSQASGKSFINSGAVSVKLETPFQEIQGVTVEKNDSQMFVTINDGQGNSFSFNRSASKSFNENTSRQQKLDVELNFGNNNYKVSAKNWESLVAPNFEHNFGETSIIYAILRTVGQENANRYLYGLSEGTWGKQRNNQTLIQAHKLAKISILVDTLMGYSQKNKFTDTLIINVRSKKDIIVASIPNIIERLSYKDFLVNNYDENLLHNNATTIMKLINTNRSQGRSNRYIDLMKFYLQSVKASITYSTIQNYIK